MSACDWRGHGRLGQAGQIRVLPSSTHMHVSMSAVQKKPDRPVFAAFPPPEYDVPSQQDINRVFSFFFKQRRRVASYRLVAG